MRTEQKLVLLPPISNSVKFSLFLHTLDLVIKIGRYFSITSIVLTGLNLVFAVSEFYGNNIVFGMIHSLFVISGIIFAIQSRVTGYIHKSG
ncbi:MAG: hypothetical protein RI100_01485 [Nitrosarchaeum sp.]|jgi:hypothetical protein|uniref:hypothetical protein n=1 Tax=Nitrosarchaeum sp. TaxID=2026886 RepID=UPI002DEDE2CB|nr:hypothetical protein [Nitrosarchaeum sp.]